MSYRQCVFAVPVDAATQTRVLAVLWSAVHDLSSQLDLPDVYVLLNEPAAAARDGAWQFLLATTRQSDRVLDRGFLVEFLAEAMPLSVILHDDSHGIYLFQHHHPDGDFSLGSDGALLFGDVERVDGPYHQRGFDHDTLRQLLDVPEGDLTPAEARAVMEYTNAVGLGIRQHYPRPLHYLDLLYLTTAWRLHDPETSVGAATAVPAPADLRNYVNHAPGEELAERTHVGTPQHAAKRWVSLGKRQPDAASQLRAFATALERDATCRAAMEQAGHVLLDERRFDEQVAMLTRLLALDPADTTARYNRACGHAGRRDKAAMLADLRRCVAESPEFGPDAAQDDDFAGYHDDPDFQAATKGRP